MAVDPMMQDPNMTGSLPPPPSQGMPPQGMPPQGMPPQGMPPQGMPMPPPQANVPASAKEMPQEALTTLMRPSKEIQAVLLARLSALEESELAQLDQVITPEVISVVVKFLPELGEIITAVADMSPDGTMQGMSQPVEDGGMPTEMGALGNVV